MCEQGSALLRAYQSAVDRYLDAFRTLRTRSGTSSKSEYKRLLIEADAARSVADAARQALVAHLKEHRCE